MMIQEMFLAKASYIPASHQVSASCPSNIALIKYWGKYPQQMPANPSISYTLSQAKTDTVINFTSGVPFQIETFLAGTSVPKFSEKIAQYFKSIEKYLPWILQGSYKIRTENTFPHSSGIASSASGFGAIAKALMQLDQHFSQTQEPEDFRLRKASFLARLGSGSACRSLYNGLVVWGETPVVEGSSDLYAVKYPDDKIHPIFREFNDWVLLIHEGQKAVSSTVGHGLMKTNPYAERRFQEAKENFIPLQHILETGDLPKFITLVEHEALTLHAMMMMSEPAFILMKTGTLEVINKVWSFRKETHLPLFFTLDAGANVHLLFPEDVSTERIKSFIETELKPHTQQGGIMKDKIHF